MDSRTSLRSFGGRCAAGSRQRELARHLGSLSGPQDQARTNPPAACRLSGTTCAHTLPTLARPSGRALLSAGGAGTLRGWMRRSTRSSWSGTGLSGTVRWAWSFSLRCTQSTVKSRRRSLARARRHRAGGPGLSGGLGHCQGDVGVGAGALHLLAPLQLVERHGSGRRRGR